MIRMAYLDDKELCRTIKEEYENIIKDNNQHNVIIFPFKERKELFELMKCCDGFITLSTEDIYGHTTNEAFAMGLPVLSSNKVVGSNHLIKDGENGFVVDLSQKSLFHKVSCHVYNLWINFSHHPASAPASTSR